MAGPYSAGTVFLQVVPSYRGFQESVRRQAKDAARAFSEEFDREAGAAAKKSLDRIAKQDSRVNVSVDADTTRADAKLRAVEALKVLASKNINIKADADTARARAALRALRHEADKTSHSGDEAGNSMRALNLILLAIVSVGPAIIPMLGALAGALAAIGPLAIGAGAGLGVMVLGFSGIADAVKGMSDVAKTSAKDSHAAAKTIRAAAEGVADAERGLARARENAAEAAEDAARRVSRAQEDAARSIERSLRTQKEAEERLADAQRKATAAQQALRQARRDAQADLDDIADRQRQNALDERQAVVDLFNATVADQAARQDPGATNLEKEQASIQLGNARERLSEIREEEERLAAERRKGVDGTERVVSAQERVVAAMEAQQDAQRALADATREVDQARIDGAEQVSDALRAQARTAEDSAESIEDAQRGLVRAQQNQRDAILETSTLGSAAAQRLEEAMGKLSPTAQAFAIWLFSLRDEFYKLRAAAAEGMLPGVMDGLKLIIDTYGPGLIDFVGEMASVIGDLWRLLGETLTGPLWKEFFGTFADTGPTFLREFGEMTINWLTVFGALMDAVTPLALKFSKALLRISERAKNWAVGLEDTKGFQGFMAYVERVGPKVLRFFKALWDAAVNIAVALAPFGETIMVALTGILDLVAGIDPKILGPIIVGIFALTTAFQAASAAVGFFTVATRLFKPVLIGNVLVPLGLIIAVAVLVGFALFMLWTKSETFRDIVKGALHAVAEAADWVFNKVLIPAFHYVVWGWQHVLLPAFKAIWEYWKFMARTMKWVWDNILWPVFNLLGVIVKALWRNVIKPYFGYVAATWTSLGKGLQWVWRNVIKPVFDAFMEIIGDDLVDSFKSGMKGIKSAWETLKNIAKAPVKFVIDTVINDGLIDGFNAIAKFFGVKKKDRMSHIPLPKGFSSGGYTGRGGRDEAAGIVHRDEYVISSPARRRFERRAPGALDYLNRTGSLPGYANGGRVVWPAPGQSPGLRFGNTYSDGRFHSGQDFPGPTGSRILAALNGVVAVVKHMTRSYGNHVIMRHSGGAETLYGHMSKIGVKPGQLLAAGQLLGLMGATGNATGPHLHFEYRTPPGGYGNAINPMGLLTGAAQIPGFGKMDGSSPGFFPNPISWLKSKIAKPMARLSESPFGRLLTGFPNKAMDWIGSAVGGAARGVFNFGKGVITDGLGAVGDFLHIGGRGDADETMLYDNGGMLPTGYSSILNATGKPERILTDEQWESLRGGGGGFKAYIDARGTKSDPDDIADALLFAGRKMSWGGVYAEAGAH